MIGLVNRRIDRSRVPGVQASLMHAGITVTFEYFQFTCLLPFLCSPPSFVLSPFNQMRQSSGLLLYSTNIVFLYSPVP